MNMTSRHNVTAILIERDEADAAIQALGAAIERTDVAIDNALKHDGKASETSRRRRDQWAARTLQERDLLKRLMIALGA